MLSKNSSKPSLERRLNAELPSIIRFFSALTGLKVPMPKVRVSNKVKDVEWYTENTIFINPGYTPKDERISNIAMLAHGFFHHVQYCLFRLYEQDRVRSKSHTKLDDRKLADLINNFVESSAMFFAVAYMTRRLKGERRTKRILAYLNSKAYTPPAGNFFSGNKLIIIAYEKNNYNIRRIIKGMLSYSGAIKIMQL